MLSFHPFQFVVFSVCSIVRYISRGPGRHDCFSTPGTGTRSMAGEERGIYTGAEGWHLSTSLEVVLLLALNTHKVTCYQQVRNGRRGGEGGEGGSFWTKNQIVTFQIFLFELRGIKSLPLQHPRSKESCMDRTNILMNHSFDKCKKNSLEFVIKDTVTQNIFS